MGPASTRRKDPVDGVGFGGFFTQPDFGFAAVIPRVFVSPTFEFEVSTAPVRASRKLRASPGVDLPFASPLCRLRASPMRHSLFPQQLRQLGYVGGDAPGLVAVAGAVAIRRLVLIAPPLLNGGFAALGARGAPNDGARVHEIGHAGPS